jgi:hypothetical protein
MNTYTNRQRGDLLFVEHSGQTRLLEHNLPFGVLQQRRKLYIRQGFKKEELKITYSKN